MATMSKNLRSCFRGLAPALCRSAFSGQEGLKRQHQRVYSAAASIGRAHTQPRPFQQPWKKGFGGFAFHEFQQARGVPQQGGGSTLHRVRALLTGVKTRCQSSLATASSTIAFESSAASSGPALGHLVAGGERAQRQVGWWLFTCTGWVGSMVVLGGVTRLTRSGLSMTEWRFTGKLPPITEDEWKQEFDKYKRSPEYERVNQGMLLADFKFIYWMEYAHRMWGRALGVVFLGPCAYFAARGFITRKLAVRLGILGALGTGQGFIGWWMVKSGLEKPASEHVIPRVSPYRLATHLASAFTIYCGLLWTALSVAMPVALINNSTQLVASAKARRMVHAVAALVGITALSGAFVAGNDAGHAYNTFPKMGDSWIPPSILELQPIYRNFFENTATVQFDHRVLATSTLASVGILWASASKLPLHHVSKKLLGAMLGMTAVQVTLGISTLLMYVPVSLGSAHQTGALALFTILLTLMHTLRLPSGAAVALRRTSLGHLGATPLNGVFK